jgi:hypothetical protein
MDRATANGLRSLCNGLTEAIHKFNGGLEQWIEKHSKDTSVPVHAPAPIHPPVPASSSSSSLSQPQQRPDEKFWFSFANFLRGNVQKESTVTTYVKNAKKWFEDDPSLLLTQVVNNAENAKFRLWARSRPAEDKGFTHATWRSLCTFCVSDTAETKTVLSKKKRKSESDAETNLELQLAKDKKKIETVEHVGSAAPKKKRARVASKFSSPDDEENLENTRQWENDQRVIRNIAAHKRERERPLAVAMMPSVQQNQSSIRNIVCFDCWNSCYHLVVCHFVSR